jgi:hypothetical protein
VVRWTFSEDRFKGSKYGEETVGEWEVEDWQGSSGGWGESVYGCVYGWYGGKESGGGLREVERVGRRG